MSLPHCSTGSTEAGDARVVGGPENMAALLSAELSDLPIKGVVDVRD
jgi:hypothetical protein